MKIVQIEVDHFDVPLPTVLTDSTHGEMSYFELVTVRVRCDGGEEGLGYTYTVGCGGASIHALIERYLVPHLLGTDPRCVEKRWEEMWWRLHYVGRGGIVVFAISAVDIALWDLKGRVAGEPLWRLLGGHSPEVRAYAGGIDLLFPLDKLMAQTESFLSRGFRAIKMKVGRERLYEDVERVAAMRDSMGPDVTLMVDANMRWTVEHAIRAARELARFDIYWLEEPTIPDDFEGHARIVSEGGVPVATGENMHSIYEFQRMIAVGKVAFPEPDVSNIGGITPWMKIAHLAEAHNVQVTTHGVHDLHVHLLAAVPNASFLETHGFGLEAFIRHPMELDQHGMVHAPDRPGHGVELDWKKLEVHRAR
jgi:L-alanine-DL-glutamate epimerase-like enolase superfamily enzyme